MSWLWERVKRKTSAEYRKHRKQFKILSRPFYEMVGCTQIKLFLPINNSKALTSCQIIIFRSNCDGKTRLIS